MSSLVTMRRVLCRVGKVQAKETTVTVGRLEGKSSYRRWQITDVRRSFAGNTVTIDGLTKNGWRWRMPPLCEQVTFRRTGAVDSESRQLCQMSHFVPAVKKPASLEGLMIRRSGACSRSQIHSWSPKMLSLKRLIRCLSMDAIANVNGQSVPYVADQEDYSFEATKGAALRARKTASGLLCFHCDHHVVELPPGHRFPMTKYRRTRHTLEGDRSLMGLITIFKAPKASVGELHHVHVPEYVKKVLEGKLTKREQSKIGLPWSQSLVDRSLAAVGGTVAATHAVMSPGEKRLQVAAMLAGGTHHAFQAHGEGFCVFNDIGVAAAICLDEYKEECNSNRPVLILDLDVHQGNGTAALFEGDPRVITFSMHGEKNYPWRSKMKSTYDVELEDECDDATYLKELSKWVPHLFHLHEPGVVFFQSGVDALKEDKFGRLALTREGLLRRNNIVYSACIAAGIPLVITMGGGYSNPIDYSVTSHADVYRSAAYRFFPAVQVASRS